MSANIIVGSKFNAVLSCPEFMPEGAVEGDNFSFDIKVGENVEVIGYDESLDEVTLRNLSLEHEEAWVKVSMAQFALIKGL